MSYRTIKGYQPSAQLALLLAFTGMGVVIASFLQLSVAQILIPPGLPLSKMDEAVLQVLSDPANAGYIRLAQGLGAMAIFLMPALLVNYITQGKSFFWLGFNAQVNLPQLIFGFLLIIAANFISAPVDETVKWVVMHFPSLDSKAVSLEKAYIENLQAMGVIHGGWDFILSLFIMALLPALFEEVFFRGLLQQLFVRWWGRPMLGILAASLVFSLVHASIYLFAGRAILGFALGYMFYLSKNIWLNVVAHFLNNAVAVFQLYWVSRGNGQPIDTQSKFNPLTDYWFALMAVIAAYFVYKALVKWSAKNNSLIENRESALLTQAASLM